MLQTLAKRALLLCAVAVTVMTAYATSARAEDGILVKSGETIAFLGDSITQQGAGSPAGYVNLVIRGLKENGVEAKMIGAGISGHKSNQMLERLKKDVLDKKPEWMTLSCGVNDVWHGDRGVKLEDYKKNITAIVEQAQAAGIKVVILTATMIREDPENDLNKKLAPYNDFLRELAAEKKLPLADLNLAMQKKVAELNAGQKDPGNKLTGDGVHMNPLGNITMALGVLKALGLSEAQLAALEQSWMTTLSMPLNAGVVLSPQRYLQLQKAAAAKGMSAEKFVSEEVKKAVDALIAPAPGEAK